MYKQITLLLSFLFISISFCDTIKYKERKSSGDFEIKVVTDVEFLGVSRKGLHYQKSTFFGNVLKTIPCANVDEILDSNNIIINYSCLEFTYVTKAFYQEENVELTEVSTIDDVSSSIDQDINKFYLKSGNIISGTISSETDSTYTLDTAFGTVALNKANIYSLSTQSVECFQLGTIAASENTNGIFVQGMIQGLIPVLLLVPTVDAEVLYKNNYNEINKSEVDFKDYVSEQDCRQNYIEGYKKEHLRIREKGFFSGIVTLFGIILIIHSTGIGIL